jgi:hypothetical protein
MKKIPVIFFLLCFISIIIFNKFKSSNKNVLYLGDNEIFYKYISKIDKFNINKYTYDSVTYKKIVDEIKDNSYKIIKDKNIYLNQLISDSDVIILSANNFEYKNKCEKIDRIINDYDLLINDEINLLISVLKKISTSKIIILGNSCNKKEHVQELNLLEGNYINIENIRDLDKFISKIINN